MTGLEQAAPEKETQPVEMPDDEVLYELADLFRVAIPPASKFCTPYTTASFACRISRTPCS